MAVALEWVSRITAVALTMVLPGLLGYWLDGKFDTRFLAPAGFVFGIVAGMWSLLVLTGAVPGKSRRTKGSRPGKNQENQQT
ncbi:MAG: AtpZ/AtpI family protein [Pirellulales bacterium]